MVPVATRTGKFEEAESLLAAAEALWPECPKVQFMRAGIFCARRDYVGGLSVVASGDQTDVLAMRAYCLLELKDPSWEGMAREVLARGDCALSSTLMRRMLEIEQRPLDSEEPAVPSLNLAFLHMERMRA
jgi:hypothetical protein